ncbi:MAG: esterase/lipase family protein [Betaproteobacteria bacterium]
MSMRDLLGHDPSLRPPGLWQMLLEGRAPWEYAATIAATPWFSRLPAGDEHPVIVFPGLGVSDLTTAPMRSFLRARGYTAYPWEQGFNFGPRGGVIEACEALVREKARRHGEPVSLVGWSLGGLFARELAKAMPQVVRCVITLGSPFSGHPRATNAWRLFELVSGTSSALDPELVARLHEAPPVPTTSIYSRSDGVVAWRCSLNHDLPHTENIEVPAASHLGMGLNPLVLYVIADRLAQQPQAWRRFEVDGARRWFFRTEPPRA